MTKEETGMPFFLCDWAVKDMQYLSTRILNKKIRRDAVIIISGDEGTGKTTIASQLCYYLVSLVGKKLTLDNFYFTPNQIYNAVMKGNKPPGTPFIYDEGVTGLLAKQAMSKMHIKLQIMFSTCRSKRYPIFVCIPRFRELPDWLAIDRSLALFTAFNKQVGNDPDHPGFYVGYAKQDKKWLWLHEKSKRFDLSMKVRHTSTATFPAWFPFDNEEYERHKRNSLAEADSLTPEANKSSKYKERYLQAGVLLTDRFGMSKTELASELEMERSSLSSQLTNYVRSKKKGGPEVDVVESEF
ncbi:hypothetical protein LCGC14_0484830 [marine sediment metagenome]|uniref:Novel STAND NTPase 3 domain-containing protein n=1 Tax=marine sediment metagenome TaxID=412755 RepID=A0A0F9S861_9ZZZZ